MSSNLTNLKSQVSAARARVRFEEAEMRRMGASAITSFALGAGTKADGWLHQVPGLFGLPKTVSFAILAKGASAFASGDLRDYLDGAGDAAASVAIFQLAQGGWGAVSGLDDVVSGDDISGMRDAAKRLRQRLNRAGAASNDDDSDDE